MFGERLKELRHNNKLTQQGLANILKVSASTIGMYEQGRRSPDTGTLNQVAEHFDVSVDWLLGRTYIPNNKLIEKYSTKELVNELTLRPGVIEVAAEPLDRCVIEVGNEGHHFYGPARILRVID